MQTNDTLGGRYHYHTYSPDGIGLDRYFIAVDSLRHDDLMRGLGWSRVLYKDLTRYITSTEINKLKYGDPGIEHRKTVYENGYELYATGRTIDDLADEWADREDEMDAAHIL